MTDKQYNPVRSRDAQVEYAGQQIVQSSGWANLEGWMRSHILEAEARGAEEQRRKDGELSRAKLFCQNEKEASDRTPERPDVVQWQKDRNEFFLSSTLEVVTEYAAWRDTKDGEARDTPSAYVLPDDFYNDEGDERCGLWSGDQIGRYTLPLYTRPANVAGIDVDAVIQNVSELPDRTSPDDQPDLLMVTADELRLILSEAQPANVAALEAEIASLKEAEQLARADAEASKARVEMLQEALVYLEGEARRFASHYPAHSDGWNTFIIFADKIHARAALTREGGV